MGGNSLSLPDWVGGGYDVRYPHYRSQQRWVYGPTTNGDNGNNLRAPGNVAIWWFQYSGLWNGYAADQDKYIRPYWKDIEVSFIPGTGWSYKLIRWDEHVETMWIDGPPPS